MQFKSIKDKVNGIPYIRNENAEFIYNFIIENKPEQILELGIGHGAGTCYMAAALEENKKGKITAVDLLEVDFKPSAEDLTNKFGLGNYVEVVRMKSGYNWFLHDEIKKNTVNDVCLPKYDLCIIDGPKNWTIDGFAFFLVDKLLKDGATIIFDDYYWKYKEDREETDGITHRSLSIEEKQVPHIKEVFELLVKQHSNYGEFILIPDSDWAIAKKNSVNTSKTYKVEYHKSNKDILKDILRKIKLRLS
jgi:predicted O-methyltransferase YrrM